MLFVLVTIFIVFDGGSGANDSVLFFHTGIVVLVNHQDRKIKLGATDS